MEHFGRLPGFNFLKVSDLSPGSPTGRKSHSEEEELPTRSRKRTERSESSSPPCPEAVRQKINEVSHDDDTWNGFVNQE